MREYARLIAEHWIDSSGQNTARLPDSQKSWASVDDLIARFMTTYVPRFYVDRDGKPSGSSTASKSEQSDNRFLATSKQMKFIGQLCRGIKGLDNRRLDAYCEQEFGKTSKQLSAQDASKLIDMLKDAKENGGLAS